jgi:phytoene/squalene synthetase
MSFNLGNALKYIWRCDLKKDAVEDLRKARWYLDREIAKRTRVDSSEFFKNTDWRGYVEAVEKECGK